MFPYTILPIYVPTDYIALYRVTDEALIAETMVWPNFFLMNVFFALKGSKLFIIISFCLFMFPQTILHVYVPTDSFCLFCSHRLFCLFMFPQTRLPIYVPTDSFAYLCSQSSLNCYNICNHPFFIAVNVDFEFEKKKKCPENIKGIITF